MYDMISMNQLITSKFASSIEETNIGALVKDEESEVPNALICINQI